MSQSYRSHAWLLAFCMGFLSLSEEVLWVRIVTFVEKGVPHAFAFVLATFLLGVALGAALGRRACRSSPRQTLGYGIALVVAGALLDLALPQIIGWVGVLQLNSLLLVPLIIVTAASKAALFPIAHYLGSEATGGRTGRTVSRVYFMNIAGSTLGPLLTGFVLLDYVSTQTMFELIGVVGLALAAVLSFRLSPRLATGGLAIVASAATMIEPGDHTMIRSLAGDSAGARITHVIENRQGILHTVNDGWPGDVVYGGNVYDGRTNVDLVANSNRIDRVYLLAALHPAPKRILMIGLSTGAWTRVLSSFPEVERIDVVEINPGYLELTRNYPGIAPILDDARIHIHVDDGRRWLRHHPEARFDLIVMNTTFHWRAYITNLLSVDFLSMVRDHLAPGGMLAFNATGSHDAFYTATRAFPHAYRWGNFIYAAEQDFRGVDLERARGRLMALRQWNMTGGREKWLAAVDRMLAVPFATIEEDAVRAGRPLEVITVQNMITEFRYGRGL